jgi:hypothetical protein
MQLLPCLSLLRLQVGRQLQKEVQGKGGCPDTGTNKPISQLRHSKDAISSYYCLF